MGIIPKRCFGFQAFSLTGPGLTHLIPATILARNSLSQPALLILRLALVFFDNSCLMRSWAISENTRRRCVSQPTKHQAILLGLMLPTHL